LPQNIGAGIGNWIGQQSISGILPNANLSNEIANAYTQPHVIPYYPGQGSNGAGHVGAQ
jgi:hypothetical protein